MADPRENRIAELADAFRDGINEPIGFITTQDWEGLALPMEPDDALKFVRHQVREWKDEWLEDTAALGWLYDAWEELEQGRQDQREQDLQEYHDHCRE